MLRTALFTLLLGLLFLVVGVRGVSSGPGGEWGYFWLLVGTLFSGWGVSHLLSARRMSQKRKSRTLTKYCI